MFLFLPRFIHFVHWVHLLFLFCSFRERILYFMLQGENGHE